MFAALAVAFVIGERPVSLGRIAVVFLDAPAHLRDQFLSQRLQRRNRLFAIGVLGLEQRRDVFRQGARIAQHLAPILGGEPGVGVGDATAVHLDRRRALLGAGRRRPVGAAAIEHEASPFKSLISVRLSHSRAEGQATRSGCAPSTCADENVKALSRSRAANRNGSATRNGRQNSLNACAPSPPARRKRRSSA